MAVFFIYRCPNTGSTCKASLQMLRPRTASAKNVLSFDILNALYELLNPRSKARQSLCGSPMKMRIIAALCALFIVGLPRTCCAQDVDAESAKDVIPGCREMVAGKRTHSFSQGICLGEVDALLLTHANLICPSKGVTLDQAARIIVQFVDGHPPLLDKRFAVVALVALQGAWPCSQKER
jgi:hypothetical protein